MALTDAQARTAKWAGKPTKLFDGGGLFLLVGERSKLWRLKYRYAGREKSLSIGAYPLVTIKQARQAAAEAKRLLLAGIDPGAERAERKAAVIAEAKNTFEAVAAEWLGVHRTKVRESTFRQISHQMTADILPALGRKPIAQIKAMDVLGLVRGIEGRGSLQAARRALQRIAAVMRYSVQTGRREDDPSAALAGALQGAPTVHRPAVGESEIGEIMRTIAGMGATAEVKAAIRLTALTLVRPSEAREAVWSEFDLDAAMWQIPAHRMKQGRAHDIPLSRQAVELLIELKKLTGAGEFLFPGRSGFEPLAESTIRTALNRAGLSGRHCAHGFRSTGSTALNSAGFSPDVIEALLSHVDSNAVRRAYNRSKYLKERTTALQWWADLLDSREAGEDSVIIGRFGERRA